MQAQAARAIAPDDGQTNTEKTNGSLGKMAEIRA